MRIACSMVLTNILPSPILSVFAASMIAAIIDAAKTDKIGDGKIFVSNIEQAIRIRTGESGSEAL